MTGRRGQTRRPILEDLEARILYSADHPAGLIAAALHPVDSGDAAPRQVTALASPAAQSAPANELVFIDSRVGNLAQLEADVAAQAAAGRAIEAIVVDANRDGIVQITDALAGRSDLTAIHLVSHGSEASVTLGAAPLDTDALLQRAAEIAGWGSHLAKDADLLIYGCDVGEGSDGHALVADLAALTGAHVAASDDLTGSTALGGDWTLEVQSGAIAAKSAIDAAGQTGWQGVLATYTVTNTNNSGTGSLRTAIMNANSNSGADTINFAISGTGLHTINLTNALPTITGPVTIDGYTQSGSSVNTASTGTNAVLTIHLNGSSAGAGVNGLSLGTSSGGSVVRGLAIGGFSGYGVYLLSSSGDQIVGNFIGTNAAGTAALANGWGIVDFTANLHLGSSALADRNLISGNTQGVDVSGAAGAQILGNYFGTNASGLGVIANGGASGYSLNVYGGASGVQIGGTAAGQGNVFRGGAVPIIVSSASGGSAFAAVLGNSIDGSTGLGLDLNNDGVTANDAGDADAGPNNLQNFPVLTGARTNGSQVAISGSLNSTANGHFRIEFFASPTANSSGYGAGQRYLGFANVATDASGNATFNATLTAAVAAGESVSATATLSNSGYTAFTSTSEFAHDTTAASSAVISSNGGGSSAAIGVPETTTAVTTVAAGNHIGTVTYAISGGADAAKFTIDSSTGVLAFAAAPDFESPTNVGADNVYNLTVQATDGSQVATQAIAVTVTDVPNTLTVTTTADNNDSGIVAGDSTETNEWLNAHKGADGAVSLREAMIAANNTVGADTISFNIAGSGVHTINVLSALPAVTDQLTIDGTTQSGWSANTASTGTNAVLTIELDGASAGSGANGIELDSGSGSVVRGLIINRFDNAGVAVNSPNVVVAGNFIGVSTDGLSGLGNGDAGIRVNGQTGTTIGGAALADRNLISANVYAAMYLSGANGTLVYGNLLGTDAHGTFGLQNGSFGVVMSNGGSLNQIGGTGAGQGNVLSNWNALVIDGGSYAAVLGNSIDGTIDDGYDGVDVNDAGDADGGANGKQNYPVLSTARTNGSQLAVAGTLNTNSNGTYRIEFFAGSTADGSGHGTNGVQRFLGYVDVATDASGNAAFASTLSTAVAAGEIVTATATVFDAAYTSATATSEFAQDVTTASSAAITSNGGSGTAAVSVAENTTAVTTVAASGSGITYSIVGGPDSAKFTIDAATGALAFAAAPDYEAPTDSNADNVYNVTVQASDGMLSSTQAIAVTVSDVPSTLTVTTAADNNDSGIVAGNATETSEWLNAHKGTDGAVSLREAIIAANNTPGADTISFAIPGTGVHTINLASALPSITGLLTIDGYTQSGSSVNTATVGTNAVLDIELNGASAGAGATGLLLSTGSDGSTIRGLVVNRFSSVGIWAASPNDTIVGNFIGTNAAGTAALANGTNAGDGGVYAGPAGTAVKIGSAALADRNLISGNTYAGIYLSGNTGAVVQGNDIGTDATGLATLANSSFGLTVSNTSTGEMIGGTAPGQGNTVFGGGRAIVVTNGSGTTAVAMLGNLVKGNSGTPIDLGNDGVTTNDPGDGDTGPNNLQNYPVLTSAKSDGTSSSIIGTLNSTAGTPYRIEFFATTSADASGHGGAQRYLGFVNVTTNGSGNASFTAALAAGLSAGEIVTATATQSNAGYTAFTVTSEFAANIAAASSAVITSNGGGANASVNVPEDTTAVTTVIASGSGITYSISGGADAGKFTINASTGVLAFANAPDFEAPTDAGSNNVYDVLVRASDGALTSTQAIAVTVTDVPSTLTVTTAADNNDSGIVAGNATETNEWLNAHKGADGAVSLREAIIAANNTAGADTIGFAIAGSGLHTINLASALPTITGQVTIDGYTQAGSSVNTSGTGTNAVLTIELNGASAGSATNGLTLDTGSDGSTVRGLVIDRFGQDGIYIAGSGGNLIAGNFIGTDATGSSDPDGSALVGGAMGLGIGSADNVIGGTTLAARNLISGNNYNGINFGGSSATGNRVQGNLIGTDRTGLAVLANSNAGVAFWGSGAGNVVGGSQAGARNVIAGNNSGQGVFSGNSSAGMTIQGNSIGVDMTGLVRVGNLVAGVYLGGGTSGVLIGTDADGTNDAAEGNVIGGGTRAVFLNGAGSSATIAGNDIGVGIDGTTALGNTYEAVYLEFGASAMIGGTASGAGNVIANNARAIGTDASASTAFTSLGNSIYADPVSPAIDLGSDGVTPNDAGDADTGPNGLQNFPVLARVITNGPTVLVGGSFNSTASSYYRLEFFASPSADASGYGPGKRFLGYLDVATDASGNASFGATLGSAVAAGEVVSATATRSNAGYTVYSATSEFSADMTAVAATAITSNGGGTNAAVSVAENTTAVTTVTTAGSGITYSISGGADAAKFTIDASTGALAFTSAPDYENPTDAGTDNVYNLVVQTSNGSLTSTQAIAVTVTDVPSTLTVTTAADNDDAGIVAGNATETSEWLNAHKGADGAVSLREAIIAANNTAGADTINFAIAGSGLHTINLASALPTLTDQTTIDGYSQTGASANTLAAGTNAVLMIVLDGTSAGASVSGLTLASGSGGSAVRGLVIRAFNGYGVEIDSGSDNDVVAGDYIGALNADGSSAGSASANAVYGIRVSGNGATVGGTTPQDRNVLSGNAQYNVRLDGSSAQVVGNYIGTDVTGLLDVNGSATAGNQSGVLITGSGNTIGGTTAAARNVISGNNWYGVEISGSGSLVRGNYIGTDRTGQGTLGNSRGGVIFWGATGTNTVGGSAAGAGNVIAANNTEGIYLGSSTSGSVIQGNLIGVAADGVTALGTQSWGVDVGSATGTLIGTNADGSNDAAEGNVIGGRTIGVWLAGGSGTIVAGNRIGVGADGTTAVGNGTGISVASGATALIGGTAAAAANQIANNGRGIVTDSSASDAVAILGNSIRAVTTAPGIDLLTDGVTANDAGDADTGPNGLQNYPVLTVAATDGSHLLVTGTLNSNAGSSYRIELFASPSGNSVAHGDAATYLGFVNVTTDGSGNASFGTTLAVAVPVGQIVTATATRSNAGFTTFTATSEFAQNVAATNFITSNGGAATAAVGVPETTTAVTTVTATGSGIVYSIAGGSDSARFTIDSATGALTFSTAPDFEAPTDANADNVYNVTVQASNGTMTQTQAIAVTVTDVSNALVVTTAADNNDAGIVAGNATETSEWLNAHRGADGAVSLREAIIAADNTAGADTIRFAIAGSGLHTINLASALPTLTGQTTIDGYTQAGASVNTATTGTNAVLTIEINGASITGSGLLLGTGSAGSVVRGLVLDQFGQANQSAISVRDDNVTITGNFIGTDATGSVARGNFYGIHATARVANTRIGGTALADRNLIDAASFADICLDGSSGSQVYGNVIGTDPGGVNALGGGSFGVLVFNGATGVQIGGTAAGQGNTIVGAHRAVAVTNGTGSTTAAVLGNLLYGSSGLALDLGADDVTANDPNDADTGPNNLQNFPVLASARVNAAGTAVSGSINTDANAYYRIEFYASPTGNSLGHGDAKRFLGYVNVATDASGNASFGTSFAAGAFAVGDVVSATATKATSAAYSAYTVTSEFAQNTTAISSAVITSNGGAASASVTIAENTTAVTTVAATGSGIVYSIAGGADAAKFTINASTGALAFATAPDYENPTDVGTDNVYDLVVQASDRTLGSTQALAVGVANANDAPVLTPIAPTLATITEDQTGNTGQTVASFIGSSIGDQDSGAVRGVAITTTANGNGAWQSSLDGGATWTAIGSVSGASALLLRSTDYVRFMPNAQNGTTASIGYRAWDQTSGSPGAKADASANGGTTAFSSATDTATITVTSVDDAPVGTSKTVTTNEDTPYTFSAADFGFTDVDIGDSLSAVRIDTVPAAGTLKLSGVSVTAGQVITAANLGNLVFLSAQDANGIAYASVNFSVRDQSSAYDASPKTITVNVTPVDDAPVVTSNGGGASASVRVAENTTAVTTVTATDVDGPSIRYSISGGADAAKFTIDASTGVLSFVTAPDFENPTDVGANNVYDLIVQASDGTLAATQAIAVTVTDVSNALVVTTTADDDDSGIVAGNSAETAEWLNAHKGADNAVSLREAIIAANNMSGLDTISFAIAGSGVHTISLQSALPEITDAVVIDGYTQAGASVNTSATGTNAVLTIELDGTRAGSAADGLSLGAGSSGSTLRGLVINRFGHDGIFVYGSDHDLIAGNFIGTDASGTADLDGTAIVSGSMGIGMLGADNVIGGTSLADRNLISGNNFNGINIADDASTGNRVQGNLIGTDRSGLVALGNGANAVAFWGAGAGNLVGGAASGAGNVIAGGGSSEGVYSGNGTTGLTVQGNRIGVDATGLVAVGSLDAGVYLDGGTSATLIGTDADGVDDAAEANVIGGGVRGFLIAGTGTQATVAGNFVGVGIDGTTALATGWKAFDLQGGAIGTIGGTTAGAGNLIANGYIGIGTDNDPATRFAILGNRLDGFASNAAIDLASDGITANDPGDGDIGANGLQNFPVLTGAHVNGGSFAITGSLNSLASSFYRIEFYATGSGDATRHGGGQRYLGFVDVTTDASGNASFSATAIGSFAAGEAISATATQASSAAFHAFTATSEFAQNVLASSSAVLSGPSAFTVAENTTAVGAVSATGSGIVYSISGGADAAKFAIDAASGALRFVAAPDFEAPTDAGANNVYDLIVQASDGALSSTRAVTVGVVDANDAPVLTPAGPALASIDEDQISNAGQSIASIIGSSIADEDAGALRGVALAANTNGNGHWQYSLDGGSTWNGWSILVDANALLLRSSDLIRYVPDAQNGGHAEVYFVAWDQTSGSAGTYADVTVRGGATAFSSAIDTASITVASVNDAPVLTPIAPVLASITEDQTTNAGQSVASFVGVSATDVDTGAVQGIAITATTNGNGNGNGSWQYSIDGGNSWSAFGAVDDTSALLLRAGDSIRFVPDGSNGTTASITYRAWDQTAGSAGSKVDASTTGGSTAFSGATDTASIAVASVNDAPVLTPIAPVLASITEDQTTNAGQSVASLVGASIGDVDAGALEGIAITAADAGHGSWQFSLDAGASWAALGSASDAAARLLRATDLVRFVPAGGGSDRASLDYRAWDQTTGHAGGVADTAPRGGAGAFGVASDHATIVVAAVNHSPLGTDTTVTTREGTARGFDSADFGFVDVDAGDSLSAVRIDTLPFDGRLALGGTAVGVGQIVAAADLSQLVFTPAAGGVGAGYAHFAFSVRDAGGLFDTTPKSLTVDVTPVAPVIVSDGGGARVALVVAENASAVTTVRATDPSAGSAALVYGIAGGADAGLFGIDAVTGALRFVVAPDFERPLDQGADNAYEVIVDARQNGLVATQTIAIQVTDLNEAPTGRDATVTTPEDTGYAFGASDFGFDDADRGDRLGAVRIDTLPATGLLTLAGRPVAAGQVIDASALPALVFTPAADANGVADARFAFSVRDAGGLFDATPKTLTIDVVPVNDAPVLTPAAPTLPALVADQRGSAGASVAQLVGGSISDVDAGARLGIAIVAADAGNGAWQMSRDGGAHWIALGPVAEGAAVLLDASDRIRFVPNGTDATAASFSYRAWDRTDSADDARVGGGSAFSSATDTARIVVSARPVAAAEPVAPTLVVDPQLRVPENSVAVAIVGATSPNPPAAGFRFAVVGGADAARFSIDAQSGELTFVTAPDFEKPGDAGADNVYDVIVEAAADGLSTRRALQVEVTDVNDNVPVFTSAASVALAPGRAATDLAVATLTASDADARGDALVFSIVGGSDAARFAVDAATGQLRFANASAIAGAARPFDLLVRVSDGVWSSDQRLEISLPAASAPVRTPEDAPSTIPQSAPPGLVAQDGTTPSTDATVAPADRRPPGTATPAPILPADGPRAATPPNAGWTPEGNAAVPPAVAAPGTTYRRFDTAVPAPWRPPTRDAVDDRQNLPPTAWAVTPSTWHGTTGAEHSAGADPLTVVAPDSVDADTDMPVRTDIAIGIALSIGVVGWATRGAALMTSLIVSTPAWTSYDLLPVLNRRRRDAAVDPDALDADDAGSSSPAAGAMPIHLGGRRDIDLAELL